MQRLQELLEKRNRLKEVLRLMDKNASFETEEGRAYAQTLLKLVMIEMQIEALEKEGIAR